MKNGYITQVLTSVDIQGIVKIGGKVIEIYETITYRENFKVSPFGKIIEELFSLGLKFENKGNAVTQLLVKLIMSALYREFLRKGIIESYQSNSEMWMMTEYDERVLDYQKINHGNYIVRLKDDEGLEDEIKKVNTLPLQLALFILSNIKRIMNNFVHAINGFYTNDVYYTYTDSVYIESKHWEKLDRARLVEKILLQGKNDYGNSRIFYGLFLAPKKNIVL